MCFDLMRGPPALVSVFLAKKQLSHELSLDLNFCTAGKSRIRSTLNSAHCKCSLARFKTPGGASEADTLLVRADEEKLLRFGGKSGAAE